jgi:predicted metal-dependent phosphoesterase TrpH
MMGRADLHTHSSMSDGTESPSRIVQLAAECRLGGISLNDHDTIDGLKEFMTAPTAGGVIRVPALEISTHYGKYDAHLLGFFIPKNNNLIDSKLRWLRAEREARFSRMVRKAEEFGVHPSNEYLENLLEGVKSPGRPHLGRMLIDYGIVKSIDEAFDKYLNKGRPIYIEKMKLQVHDAIRLLRDAGAVPVIAHPLEMRVPSVSESLVELKEMGVLGAEVAYDYSRSKIVEEPRTVIEAAESLRLICTGGSDYHGAGWRTPIGTVSVSIDVVNQLRDAARNLGNDLNSWDNQFQRNHVR